MANEEQLEILKQGVDIWNEWRRNYPDLVIDLNEADLSGSSLRGIDFRRVSLKHANLVKASLPEADFREADMSKADLGLAFMAGSNLDEANLTDACLVGTQLYRSSLTRTKLKTAILTGANFMDSNLMDADLRDANLVRVNFTDANLTGVDLTGACLRQTVLVGTKIDKAKISNCEVYGINVWDLDGVFGEQKDLVITPDHVPSITVDNIKVAQFVYLILNNEEIRDAINTLTSKSVLILGRFAIPERKAILDALRNKLREYDLLPIVFDFDRPADKDFTETIKTLAGLCYFVIADVTNPKSSPLELQATVPDYQIPFVPIIQEGENPFAMMADLQGKYSWVLNTVTYDSIDTLMKILKPLIIDPAMKKRNELRIIKAQVPEVISGKDFLEKGKA
ncbi:MAG: pentapeptide repeat-containing protein [Anaerolineales bacterium]|nr:pentapeptide repeat-containing protein [Anaerolineales bacterium]